MVYLDTSFVAPLVISEESSDAVEALVLKLKPGELATSLWTKVELASLVSRRVRMKELSAAQGSAVWHAFDRILSETFDVLLPDAADYAAATSFLQVPETSLRAGDAFHLAIAANRSAKKILTLDAGFIEAGKRLKLPVSRGIKP